MKRSLLTAILPAALCFCGVQAHAQELISLHNANGIVPNSSISYTITDTGTARAIFPPGSSDNNVFRWTNNFEEFVSTSGAETLTVNFSAPISISQIVLGANSYYPSASIVLSVAGGTATTADFNLGDGLQALTGPTGAGSYNGATGAFGATAADQSFMIGSTSANTITSFTINSTNPEGYTLFFGTVNATAVPEPSSVALLVGLSVTGAGFLRKRLGRK